jgi:hypothetical protein
MALRRCQGNDGAINLLDCRRRLASYEIVLRRVAIGRRDPLSVPEPEHVIPKGAPGRNSTNAAQRSVDEHVPAPQQW